MAFFFRLNQIWSSRLNYTIKVGVLEGNGFGVLGICCVRWLKHRTLTFAPECCGHLSSHTGSSQTRPVDAGLIYWAQRSLFYFSLPQPLTHTLTHAENPHPEGLKREREMAPVISPLLTGTLQHSLSQSPRGDNIKQRKKPFTFYCLLPQRAHISFLTLSSSLL